MMNWEISEERESSRGEKSERSQAEHWGNGLLNIVLLLVMDIRVHVCIIQLGKQGTHRATPSDIDLRLWGLYCTA